MELLTLAAKTYIDAYTKKPPTHDSYFEALDKSFKAGAEWQKEQLVPILKTIAQWAGNLPDDRLTTKTGPNDAAARGLILCAMRQIAISAVQKFEPEYNPIQD